MRKVSSRWCSLILGASFVFSIPGAAFAQTSLTWAKVEQLRNRVHLIPNGRSARLARIADVMSIGDSLRTASSSRAELRFNDGSLARVGEQATFRFTPNTRNFQLSNGTVLMLIPPGRGRTTIQTPNAVTGIQGSALFVRVRCLAELSAESHCASPVTFVGALTNNPAGAMVAYNQDGSQQQPIYAGEMVIIEGDTITQRLEFDLETFYQTSGLVEGLQLDSPTPPSELSDELQGVWQEIQDALELQGDFDQGGSSEEIVENPGFIALNAIPNLSADLNESTDTFANFPGFTSSPAAAFHSSGQQQIAAVDTDGNSIAAAVPGAFTDSDTAVETPVTSATIREARIGTSAAPAPVSVASPTTRTLATPPAAAPNSSVPTPAVTATAAPPTTPTAPVVTAPAPTGQPVAPVVTAPAPTEQPITPVVTAPTPIEKPEVPVVAQPAAPVDTPTVATTEPPDNVVPEADQIPDREAVPTEEFDWQQPTGVDDPDILQSTDLTL